jgi:hypothetical protein
VADAYVMDREACEEGGDPMMEYVVSGGHVTMSIEDLKPIIPTRTGLRFGELLSRSELQNEKLTQMGGVFE